MLMVLASCRGGSDKPLLPNVSGKAGEVIVVMDKSDWDGNLGGETRGVLAADYPSCLRENRLSPLSMFLLLDLRTFSRYTGIYLYIIYRRM